MFFSATRASGSRLEQRLGLELFLGRLLVRDLGGAALGEDVLGEHRGADLTAGDVDHRGRLPVREADRVEHEHVALERPLRDPTLGHRGDQILIRDAFEQRKAPDQLIVALQARWYHWSRPPTRRGRCAG